MRLAAIAKTAIRSIVGAVASLWIAACGSTSDGVSNPSVDGGANDSTLPDSAGPADVAVTDGRLTADAGDAGADAGGGTSDVSDGSSSDVTDGGGIPDGGIPDGATLGADGSESDAMATDASDAGWIDEDEVDGESIASAIDWRQKGAVGPVPNGGTCAGGLTAYAVTGALAGTYDIRTGTLQQLSPQALVDCDGLGCADGGTALSLLVGTGLPRASAYPYTATQGTCQTFTPVVHIAEVAPLAADDDDELMENLTDVGPLFVEVHDDASFMSYSGGVYEPPPCSTPALSSWPGTLVGYNSSAPSDAGEDDWIVRMPFGTSWGASGYAYIHKGPGICAFSQAVTFVGGP